MRERLARSNAEHELNKWFDPLGIAESGGNIHISFPHAFFASWFMQNYQDALKRAASELKPNGFELVYEKETGTETIKDLTPLLSGETKTGNSGFSFSDFIHNKKNSFPVETSVNFARNKCSAQCLIIYAPTGCGKTHILHAIKQEAKDFVDNKHIYFANISDLATFAHNEGEIKKERGKLAASRLALLDNAQNMKNIPWFQNVLANLLDVLPEKNMKLVLAFDRHPASCSFLNDKLRSHLESGLIIEIKPPDLDVRRQFVRQQCKLRGLELGNGEILELAGAYSEFRQLNGAIAKIAEFKAYSGSNEGGPDSAGLQKILNPSYKDGKHLDPDFIIGCAARYFKLEAREITGKSRLQHIVFARQSAMFVCRELLNLPLEAIGKAFGGKDHSSVLYSINKIIKMMDKNKDMHILLEDLKNLCINTLTTKNAVRKY